MIKICYIIGQLTRGGAERQLYELLKGINREKFLPIVISLSQGGDWVEEIRKLNICVIEIQRKKNMEISRLFKLVKLLKEINPDIVHTYMFSANSYGRIAAILSRTPVVIASERNLPDVGKDKNKYNMFVDKILALFTNGIICNSLKASEVLINKYSFNSKKIFTIYNGVNTDVFTLSSNSKSQKIARKVIGTVGRLSPQKNHRLFLDVAKSVLDSTQDDDMKFVVIGKGPLKKELEEYAQNIGIADRVVFAGERKDVPELLKSMDVFLMTSLYEGMSNAIMEAMLAGLPVVANYIGGNSELVIDGETGFLCPSNDAIALAEKVIYLLNNEDEAKFKGHLGKMRIMHEFGIEKMIKETEDIYLKLLKKEHIIKSSLTNNLPDYENSRKM